MNAIRKWLYIGKYRDTLDPTYLAVRKIGAVLQLAEPIQYRDIESLYLPVEYGMPLGSYYLRQGVDFILGQKKMGRNVLIACGSGMSRSTAFAVSTLNEDEGLSLLEALRVVKSHHSDTMIHPVLWKSLCDFYREDAPFERVLIT